ncbi:MAG TPA: twin-arginine translocase TatA/TatE family subunit [Phycisphaerales bacterium]|nr:twin-arginine translocase TatA/TatE family subunit [Phycisphaerales bacterium]
MGTHTAAFIRNLSMWEILIILAVFLLLFGRKLPQLGKSLGQGIIEFKRGLKGIGDEPAEEETSRKVPAQHESR